MTTRVASIDIGTNSTRLLIAEVRAPNGAGAQPNAGPRLRPIVRRAEVTRLGEGVDSTGHIAGAAAERTLRTLDEYRRLAETEKATIAAAAATSATRDADNSADFLERASGTLGFPVQVLSGEDEARLSFLGATRMLPVPSSPVLVADVGGGSTEFIFGRAGHLEGLVSVDVGCVRLTEMFVREDPPVAEEVDAMAGHARTALREAVRPEWLRPPPLIVAVAGTATSLSAVDQGLQTYDPEKVHLSRMSVRRTTKLLTRFLSMPLEERRALPGLQPERADVIIAGAVIMLEVLAATGAEGFTVSEHDILDGLILNALSAE